jgi:GR25 family glycosyltransferase involved in LPS biosynthesis
MENMNETISISGTDTFLNFEKKLTKHNIIISLTTLPPRFIKEDFIQVIKSLYEQTLRPKYIIINLCLKYYTDETTDIDRQKDLIKELFGEIVVFNICSDYGSAITKLLGLFDLTSIELHPEDRIISVDDEWKYHNVMTSYYETCYQLYNCEAVFVDESQMIEWNTNYFNHMKINKYNTLFYDNYQRSVFGWLSFSIKYKYISEMKEFFDTIRVKHPTIILHDDLFFTIFYKSYKLYACGISFLFPNVKEEKMINALKNQSEKDFRFDLEQKLFDEYKFPYTVNYIENYDNLIFRVTSTKERDFLTNVSNLKQNQKKEDSFSKYSLHFNYVNKDYCILTVTFYDKPSNYSVSFYNSDVKHTLDLHEEYTLFSQKKSFVLNGNFEKNNSLIDTRMFATSSTNEISRKRFYSLMTFQSGIHTRFEYFNDNDVEQFIINNYKLPVYELYKKLRSITLKVDLFRALYILKNGALYFNLEMLLLDPNELNSLLKNNPTLFVKEFDGLLWSNKPPTKYYKTYISNMLLNIYQNNSKTNTLGKYENTIKVLYNFGLEDNNGIYSKTTSNMIIKNSFHDLSEKPYNGKEVFNSYSHSHKINGIGHILWINLERAGKRGDYMKNILSTLKIPNTRIDAIDGKTYDMSDYKQYTYMTNYEVGATLSHIKAINTAKTLFDNPEFKSDYIMVCEDDISFDGTILAMKSLEEIIKEAPKDFDILQIHKMFFHEIPNLYSKWNDLSKPGDCVVGASCYIVSRKGTKRFNKEVATWNEPNEFKLMAQPFHVADYYIYKNTNTIVYKYNFLNTLNEDSTIHTDHIDYHKKATDFQLAEIFKYIISL